MIREAGVIESVYNEPQGSLLAADGTTGDGFVLVDDITDYTEAGGTVLLPDGSTTADYTALDADTGRITLAGTLPFDVSAGDPIRVWDPQQGAVVTQMRARVNTGGRLGNDDTLNCDLDTAVALQLETGPRDDGKGERVKIVDADEDGQWTVTKVVDRNPTVKTSALPPWKRERLTAYFNIPVASMPGASGQYNVLQTDWGLLVDEGGDAIQLGPYSGYDGIYVFTPGLYAVNLSLYVPGVTSAANSMMLQLGANISEFDNAPTATWHGDEALAGSTPFVSGSLTNYFDGSGLSGGIYAYLIYKNLDAATTTVGVNVEVVRIS